MAMGISLVELTVTPAQADEVTRRLHMHVVPVARQVAGYRGWLTADLGDSKRRDIWLFDSVEALAGMGPVGAAAWDQITPLTGPHERTMAGTVLLSDGALTPSPKGISIIEYTVDPAQADEVNRRHKEHIIPVAQQTAGYRGWLTADLGDSKRRDIWLFDSVEALAGMEALGKLAFEHIVPLTGEPERILMGTVLMSDGALAPSPKS